MTKPKCPWKPSHPWDQCPGCFEVFDFDFKCDLCGSGHADKSVEKYVEMSNPEQSEVKSLNTVEDAIDSLDRLESMYDLDDSYNAGVLRKFLNRLKTKTCEVDIPTDEEGFILEGAMQQGFDLIDDDASLYVVSANDLIAYTKRQRGAS